MSSIFNIELFGEKGFERKRCPTCGRFFWTLNPEIELCGDQPCVEYSFLGNPPVQSSLKLTDIRETFLSFFEEHGHERIGRYPVVARWRDDVFLVGASIYDFQPWVTSGTVPPPANPLTISQPSIRLTDIDNVGRTGRHLTEFEMMAHHAFNFDDKEIYWNNRTVELCFDLFTERIGIPPDKLTFIEDLWRGGGNAGEDFEVLVDGCEIATLVFMQYKVQNGDLVPMSTRVVDTGYGLQRILWLTKGTPTIYDAIFGDVLDFLRGEIGLGRPEEQIFLEASKLSGQMELSSKESISKLRAKIASRIEIEPDELESLMHPHELVYAIADHTHALIFMMGDGVVPSNVGAGYLARLLIRKSLRYFRELGLELPLRELVSCQIQTLSLDFPEFKEIADEILEIVDVEEDRHRQVLRRGEVLVKRVTKDLRAKKTSNIPTERLVEFYDSHGLTPGFVKDIAEEQGVQVSIPEDFYAQVAARHEKPKPEVEEETTFKDLSEKISGIPPTKLLFYEDPYLNSFSAKVLKVIDDGWVVLDQTAFYSEGGGQPADYGIIKSAQGEGKVGNTQRIGNIILHLMKDSIPAVGETVSCLVDWDRRKKLMRSHTATHIVNGAARRVLGQHVWQCGAQKGLDVNRLDITHHKHLDAEQVKEIEMTANSFLVTNTPINVSFVPREEAEQKYGFRLYQGGAVPGREIRVVQIGDWEVEACGGTHCRSTGEVGLIKLLRSERIQDGVERLVYAVGPSAVELIQERDMLLETASSLLGVPVLKVDSALESVLNVNRKTERRLKQVEGELSRLLASSLLEGAEEVSGIKLITYSRSLEDIDFLIDLGGELSQREPKAVSVLFAVGETARVIVTVGDAAVNSGIHAGKLAEILSKSLGGGGGGKADFGQGGGPNVELVSKISSSLEELIRSQAGS
jgi:alanyl-tRNA synthetase